MATLLTLCKKKANLKMETVHEFVQKLQPYWHCATKSKKAQSENGNFGVDKKNDLVQPKLLWLRWCERRDSSQIKSRQLLAGLWDCFRNTRKYKVQNIPSDGVQCADYIQATMERQQVTHHVFFSQLISHQPSMLVISWRTSLYHDFLSAQTHPKLPSALVLIF